MGTNYTLNFGYENQSVYYITFYIKTKEEKVCHPERTKVSREEMSYKRKNRRKHKCENSEDDNVISYQYHTSTGSLWEGDVFLVYNYRKQER